MYCFRKLFSVTNDKIGTLLRLNNSRYKIPAGCCQRFALVAHFLRSVFPYQFRGDRLSAERRWSLSAILSRQTGLLFKPQPTVRGRQPVSGSDTCKCRKYPTLVILTCGKNTQCTRWVTNYGLCVLYAFMFFFSQAEWGSGFVHFSNWRVLFSLLRTEIPNFLNNLLNTLKMSARAKKPCSCWLWCPCCKWWRDFSSSYK